MRRFAALAVAILTLVPLTPIRPAYSAIPILGDSAQPALTLAPVIKRVAPAVVSIAVRAPKGQQNTLFDDPLFRGLFGLPDMPSPQDTVASGSGVVIDAANGYIVTNYHVVENADEIIVTFLDGRQATGMVEGADPDTDIAVIKVPLKDLTAIPFGDSERLEVGDFVLAIGNPFGIGQTVTSGIVSGLRRTGMGLEGYEEFIQTDASINPGNSGGALVNLSGQLIGINAAIVGPNGGNVGIGFAIPIHMVRAIAAQLVSYGSVDRGELGFAVANLSPELAARYRVPADGTGVIVTAIDPDSAAERAGVKPGDIVTGLNGMPVRDVSGLRNRLGLLRVGDIADLALLRNAQALHTRATMSEPGMKTLRGAEISPLFQGAVFTTVAAGTLARGVQIESVKNGSQAWDSGLRAGDVVTAVNSRKFIGPDEFAAEVAKSPNRLVLDIQRGGEAVVVSIRSGEKTPSRGNTTR